MKTRDVKNLQNLRLSSIYLLDITKELLGHKYARLCIITAAAIITSSEYLANRIALVPKLKNFIMYMNQSFVGVKCCLL